MDGSMLQPLGLAALVGAMLITLYDLGASLKPVDCPECSHCRARAEADARQQAELGREYARRVGLDDPEDDDGRRIG
jgi:hypothetical protein